MCYVQQSAAFTGSKGAPGSAERLLESGSRVSTRLQVSKIVTGSPGGSIASTEQEVGYCSFHTSWCIKGKPVAAETGVRLLT